MTDAYSVAKCRSSTGRQAMKQPISELRQAIISGYAWACHLGMPTHVLLIRPWVEDTMADVYRVLALEA